MPQIKARKPKELKPDELKWTCDPAKFEFDSTSEIKPLEGILGQERAIKALKLGVDLRSQGYNIFITGLSGTGKFSTVKGMLETISPDNTTIFDYAYVNNFEDTDRPTLIKFPAGKGKKFKRNMASAIKFLQENIPMLLESDAFTAQKKKLINDYLSKDNSSKNNSSKNPDIFLKNLTFLHPHNFFGKSILPIFYFYR